MDRVNQPALIRGNRKRCALLLMLMLALALVTHQWFHPWLQAFSSRAHCVDIAGYNGSVVLFAALFIGLTFPVFLITLWLAHYARRILRSGQAPPPDAWVCRDTVPLTGKRVRIRAYAGLAMPLVGLALLGWGSVTFLDLRQNLIEPGLEKLRASCVENGGGAGYNAPDDGHDPSQQSGDPQS